MSIFGVRRVAAALMPIVFFAAMIFSMFTVRVQAAKLEIAYVEVPRETPYNETVNVDIFMKTHSEPSTRGPLQ